LGPPAGVGVEVADGKVGQVNGLVGGDSKPGV